LSTLEVNKSGPYSVLIKKKQTVGRHRDDSPYSAFVDAAFQPEKLQGATRRSVAGASGQCRSAVPATVKSGGDRHP
jgi:hypothetical protein